jgi:hypothetical protein
LTIYVNDRAPYVEKDGQISILVSGLFDKIRKKFESEKNVSSKGIKSTSHPFLSISHLELC